LAALAGSAGLVVVLPARAAGTWSASITATSDYIYRGTSRTDERPALQAGINYQSRLGWFAGAWGSGVNPYPYDQHAVEFDAYAGMGWQLSPRWSTRASYTRYAYAWDRRPQAYDYGEFAVSLGFEDRLAATVSFQPDSTQASTTTYSRHKHASSYELAGALPLPIAWRLPGQPTLLASAGYYDQSHLFGQSYWAGSAGLRLSYRKLQFEVMHFVTDPNIITLYGDSSANGRWVGSLTLRF
jgi:uncharacterized protein (TIGR02001 family)